MGVSHDRNRTAGGAATIGRLAWDDCRRCLQDLWQALDQVLFSVVFDRVLA